MGLLKNSSFRTNLIIWFIAIVLISTSSFFLLYYKLSEVPINNTLKDNLNNTSKSKAEFINYWLSEQAKVIKSLSQSNSIIYGSLEDSIKDIESHFKVHNNFYTIVLADATGKTIYDQKKFHSVNVSDRKYFNKAKQKQDYISDMLLSKTGDIPIIVVSSPIIKDGNFSGVLIGAINLSEISKLIGSSNTENINETYIIDTNGNFVVSSKTSNIDDIKNLSKIDSAEYKDLINQTLAKSYISTSYKNYKNYNVYGSFTLLPNKNWILVNELDMSKDISALKNVSLEAGILTLVAVILLFIPFIIYLSRRLTVPINNIANMIYELSLGNFEKRIEYTSNNELGILAKSFNTMADRLQNTYTELNDRISVLNEQTEEIKMKNLKLEQVIEVNKAIFQQLEDKNKQLGQENKLKAEFLANMSHEFRTPMNSIIGYTEMILDGNDGDINEEQRKDLTIILKSAEKLLGIINDVLDLSKIEAGKMTYKFKKFNLVEEVQTLAENIKVMAQSKGLDLIFECPPNLPEIYSDPVKINHIVSNILSNAVKFTDSGYVKVSITHDNQQQISVNVIDTGIGIPEEELNNIFDEFRQIDGSSTRKYGGTGLGLTIAKGLAEGIGGSVSVKSKLGSGSTFTLKIPVSKVSKDVEIKKPDSIPLNIKLPNVENDLIVVITRNTNNYNSLESTLANYGFKVICSDYEKAIQTVKATEPSCIFIDIDLPCTNCNDGWLTLADLKHDKATSNIPKIVVSTQSDNSLSYILGATDYLLKPFSTNDILRCINRCLIKPSRGYIMLIEENKEVSDLISVIIRKNTHYNTLFVNSIKDIYNVMDSSRLPSLIIMNASLASIKPIEAVNAINSIDHERKIPIIAIAEKSLNTLEQEFLRQNVSKILYNNDIRYSKLIGVIKKLVFENKYL